MKTGLDLMAEYTFLSKYSQKKEDGKLETWSEVNHRIYSTHRMKLEKMGLLTPEIDNMLTEAEWMENEKKMLSSQRGRQFAIPDWQSGILKHEAKLYNCCATYIDRLDVFSETMYLLLCGCGVGYSLHKPYTDKLPVVKKQTGNIIKYIIEDSIEGWANSIRQLIYAMFDGRDVEFDYSLIRPKGSLINNRFVAPGPNDLKKSHEKIKEIFLGAQGRKLKTIELHDIMCFVASGVVSGGVRRSALIALFDKDDEDMLNAKVGNWYETTPWRAMANNSILSTYDDSFTYNELKDKMKIVKQFGEPGFVTVPDYSYVCNPCGEIFMRPQYARQTGFAFCNLVEINAEKVKSADDFYKVCRIASFVATIQALYTDFKYLSDTTRKIADRDRNIGVSITSILSNKILRDKNILEQGAKIVATTNKEYAQKLEINSARTCTTIKPSGNASTILGLVCSGVHPAHSKKYLRRIRIKNNSPEYEALCNTPLIHKIDDNNSIISFPISVDGDDIIFKDKISAVEHLDLIKTIKHFWINKGSLTKTINHNISATIEVKDNEWSEVAAVLYTNKYLLSGVSMLPKIGDQLYFYAPFTRLYNQDIKDEYEKIETYIQTHDINFNDIMSKSNTNIDANEMTAQGCSGGACEIDFHKNTKLN